MTRARLGAPGSALSTLGTIAPLLPKPPAPLATLAKAAIEDRSNLQVFDHGRGARATRAIVVVGGCYAKSGAVRRQNRLATAKMPVPVTSTVESPCRVKTRSPTVDTFFCAWTLITTIPMPK